MQPKKEKVKKENDLSVAETIKAIRKKFGDDSIMKLDQKPIVGLDCISTGSFGLDHAVGIGGFPRSRVIEIYGPESSGKTTLALHVIAESQKENGVCAFIDSEHAMDPEYARLIGVKTEDLFISQPSSGEDALNILEDLVRSNKFDVVVVDSVATLTPRDEIEGEMGQQHIGRQARLMSHALRKLVAVIGSSKTLVIFTNQIRTTIGQIYGNPEFTPGGKALKFYAAMRIEVRMIGKIKKGEEILGSRIRAKVVKNKCAPPFKQTEYDIMYNEGVSKSGELLAMGERVGSLKKSGNAYIFGNEKLGRGYESARLFLRENPEIALRLREDILNKLQGEPMPAQDDNEIETE